MNENRILHFDHQYIDGRWVGASVPAGILITNPYTLDLAGTAPRGTMFEVEAAVNAAANAFTTWGLTTAKERSTWLRKISVALESRIDAMARACTNEVGTPLATSRIFNGQEPVRMFRYMADLIENRSFSEQLGNSQVVKEPIGVVACIPAWNVPLFLAADKVAAALAAGCTVVLKPSETSPLSACLLAQAIDEAGLPPGVFNLINGIGSEVGDILTAHPKVDMVSYTGSTEIGRHIMGRAAQSVKKVALELGGKSPCVVLRDADLLSAVSRTVQELMVNSGQICIALSRLIVPREREDEVVDIARRLALEQRMGDPVDPITTMGPLATQRHRENVRSRIQSGIDDGATLVCGGTETPHGLKQGWFVAPTVFSKVDNRMAIAQQEIFGPVLCIIPYEDEEQALSIANDTIYGLNAAVWASDTVDAVRFARRIRAGKVTINDGVYNALAPAGGYKQSGIGRERGPYGLEEFLEVKSLQFRDAETARHIEISDSLFVNNP